MANLLEQAIEIADIDVVMEVGLKDTELYIIDTLVYNCYT